MMNGAGPRCLDSRGYLPIRHPIRRCPSHLLTPRRKLHQLHSRVSWRCLATGDNRRTMPRFKLIQSGDPRHRACRCIFGLPLHLLPSKTHRSLECQLTERSLRLCLCHIRGLVPYSSRTSTISLFTSIGILIRLLISPAGVTPLPLCHGRHFVLAVQCLASDFSVYYYGIIVCSHKLHEPFCQRKWCSLFPVLCAKQH